MARVTRKSFRLGMCCMVLIGMAISAVVPSCKLLILAPQAQGATK